VKIEEKPTPPQYQEKPAGKCPFPHAQKAREEDAAPPPKPQPAVQAQPTFIQPGEIPKMSGVVPQMVFTGPVFIGYPMEQAIAFMQQYKGAQ
jgi:hypothetical protein